MGVLWIMDIFSRSFVGFHELSKAVLIFLLFPIFLNADHRATPILSNATYVRAWNIPSEYCETSLKISIDLSFFSLTGNPQANAINQSVTLFYVSKLGNYPHIEKGVHKNGGIPQLGNITSHLIKAESDIIRYLPTDQLGLAVIDWEDWRPLWVRNWADKEVYRNESVKLIKQENPNITHKDAEKLAQKNFENSGKEFMLKTLKLGLKLRPKNYWGFYLFPDCYNHNYENNSNYTGNCPDVEKDRNNQLNWLWNESTALYPSIYLNTKLKKNPKAALFSRNRIYEAIRLAKVQNPKKPLPIFVYTRLVFTDKTTEFLSDVDLVNTIGEIYALGAAGVVTWGSFNLVRNKDNCTNLKNYMKNTLGPYLINLTLAAKICNQVLCKDKGVCTRKVWNSTNYLHLNPENFVIKFDYCNKFIVFGQPSVQDLMQFSNKFNCSCLGSVSCKKNNNIQTVKKVRVCINEEVCISALINPGNRILPSRKHRITLNPTIHHQVTTTPSNIVTSSP